VTEAIAYVGLGSNLGDRAATLRAALERIDELPGTRVEQASSLYETAPVGGPAGQGPYFNAAARIATRLTPEALLDGLLAIERSLGRTRGAERDAPRTIDLDLLLHGDAVVRRGESLVVPHPRLAERAFVLAPLAEIAPDLRVPGLAPRVTVAERLAAADASGILRRLAFPRTGDLAPR